MEVEVSPGIDYPLGNSHISQVAGTMILSSSNGWENIFDIFWDMLDPSKVDLHDIHHFCPKDFIHYMQNKRPCSHAFHGSSIHKICLISPMVAGHKRSMMRTSTLSSTFIGMYMLNSVGKT